MRGRVDIAELALVGGHARGRVALGVFDMAVSPRAARGPDRLTCTSFWKSTKALILAPGTYQSGAKPPRISPSTSGHSKAAACRPAHRWLRTRLAPQPSARQSPSAVRPRSRAGRDEIVIARRRRQERLDLVRPDRLGATLAHQMNDRAPAAGHGQRIASDRLLETGAIDARSPLDAAAALGVDHRRRRGFAACRRGTGIVRAATARLSISATTSTPVRPRDRRAVR